MKHIFAMATSISLIAAPATASPRPVVEHFSRAPLNGQALPFSDAVRVGDTLYLSGQLGLVDGKLPAGIEAQTRATLDTIGAVLKRAGLGYEDVFHCTVFLADMKDWPAMNAIYVTYFPAGKRPARSAVGSNGLALGGLVEIECQAYAGHK